MVTWTLTPTGTGTHLRMEQVGFRPGQKRAYQSAKHGWPNFLARLETVLQRRVSVKKTTEAKAPTESPSKMIDGRIRELGDWRGKMLAHVRALIKAADPTVEETWKWRGVPVWEHDGILCTGETYKEVVKLTFSKGAALDDPAKLFNASLDGNVRRAIDIREGETIKEAAFKALIRAAVALNGSKAKKPKAKAEAKAATTKTR